MKEIGCNDHCTKGLRYDTFSIVFMQIFYIDNPKNVDIGEMIDNNPKSYVSRDTRAIDSQIFSVANPDNAPLDRFVLDSFEINIELDEPYPVCVSGTVYVEMSIFFDKTVSITYRIVVDKKACKRSELLTTDHIIAIASMNMGAEHWSADGCEEGSTNINLDFDGVTISDLKIDSSGSYIPGDGTETIEERSDAFLHVAKRYKDFVLKLTNSCEGYGELIPDMHYVYVDVWETVKHYDDLFSTLIEADIIKHIYNDHQREMIGLMSLYPAEWPYRDPEAFDDVCGSNVAIDTDDLILVNQNMCVVFGTYGLRGGKESATDWEEHLQERSHYHVSWPEYLLILEMILAKKYTIGYANEKLLDTVLSQSNRNTRKSIEANATLNLDITRLLMLLDAVKYSKFVSHKIMYDRTSKRLSIDDDMERLTSMMEQIDNSLNNLSDVRSLKQGTLLNIVLAGISVASLFQIIFMDLEVPFFAWLGLKADRFGISIITATIFLMVVGLFVLVSYLIRSWKER